MGRFGCGQGALLEKERRQGQQKFKTKYGTPLTSLPSHSCATDTKECIFSTLQWESTTWRLGTKKRGMFTIDIDGELYGLILRTNLYVFSYHIEALTDVLSSYLLTLGGSLCASNKIHTEHPP